MPSLLEIGPIVMEKAMKMYTDRRTDRRWTFLIRKALLSSQVRCAKIKIIKNDVAYDIGMSLAPFPHSKRSLYIYMYSTPFVYPYRGIIGEALG